MTGRFALVLPFALFLFLQYSAAQTVHTVGDSAGWRIPPNGAAFYANWAAGKTFHVGDSLVFNFTTGMDEVSRVTKNGFDICSDDNEIGDSIETGPATIPLLTPGEYYFISSEDRHCQQGQKLAINVTAAPGAPRTPPSSNTPPPTPGRAPVTHVVGDAAGWGVPQGGAIFYVNWAAGKTFVVGDSLMFNFTTRDDDVVRVTKRSFDICSDDGDIGEDIDNGPAIIQLLTPGEYYFISSEDRHCQQGQKLAINVTAAAGPMAPPSSNPPNARPPTSRPAPVTHIVGDAQGWTIPPGGAAFYVNWAAGKTFAVGDSLMFNFTTDVHDVERVPKPSFDICSDDNEIGDTIESGPATIVLSDAGEHYYISTENQDCQQGQKLAINVVATRSNGPATSITNPPTSGPTPGGSSSSPGGTGPPNSSANTVAAAVSATVFGLVLSFF